VFKSIVKLDDSAVCFWIGTGSLEQHYRDEIAHDGLSDHIFMVGVQSDIPQWLAAFDCFIFPSLWEGLPVSLVEAQAMGLPCLISDSVTSEIGITELAVFCGLDKAPEVWADKAIRLARKYMGFRTSPDEKIRNAGYDIEESSKLLARYYFDNYRRK
ncbi:glycosyltransferase, partial [Adlercreutzia sp. ZJ473]|uniref:glycosyltransferase n=1 Tax=Adlercreutzia sp. ZJ473 TaxID=2722822 RepID=UPI001553B6B3